MGPNGEALASGLGDFWGGVQSRLPAVFEASGDRGVSAVLASTTRGEGALLSLAGLERGEAAYADVLAGNPSLEGAVAPYGRRGEFLADVAAGVPVAELERKWTFRPSALQGAVMRARKLAGRLKRAVLGAVRRG